MNHRQSSRKSRTERNREAFAEVVHAIELDMPLVMHGSGDVEPTAVNAHSARLLSELTANYIASLVGAAVETQEMLNGGPRPLPPPPLPKCRKTAPPRPYEPPRPENKPSATANTTTTTTVMTNKIPEKPHRKRRRTTDEFWDEPLPEPKIKNKPTKVTETRGPKFEGVPVDEWVGVSGVDFFEANRARSAHVTAPLAIGTQSFIFPVCHDMGLYGKVLEIQAARRSIAPLLVDPVIQEALKTERDLQGPGSLRKRTKKQEENQEPEEIDSEGEDENEGMAEWPGLEYLLPLHMSHDSNRLL